MEPLAEPRRGRRRTRSARSLTDGVETLTSPRAALVRQESQKEAKRTRRALDDWRAAQTELAAIEAELRSTRIAIAALQPELEPQPELAQQQGSRLRGDREVAISSLPTTKWTAVRPAAGCVDGLLAANGFDLLCRASLRSLQTFVSG